MASIDLAIRAKLFSTILVICGGNLLENSTFWTLVKVGFCIWSNAHVHVSVCVCMHASLYHCILTCISYKGVQPKLKTSTNLLDQLLGVPVTNRPILGKSSDYSPLSCWCEDLSKAMPWDVRNSNPHMQATLTLAIMVEWRLYLLSNLTFCALTQTVLAV